MESETIKTGNYYIEREGERLKITLISPRHKNISVIPSSGNAIIIKPESSGETQFKTESKATCLRDKEKICNQCHECDIEVLNPNY